MSFFNDTNRKRVKKMQETLTLLRTSGASNGTDREQMWDMLQPLLDDIGEALGQEPEKPEPGETTSAEQPASQPKHTTPSHITLRNMAETASFEDLSWAMAVFLSRLNDHLKG